MLHLTRFLNFYISQKDCKGNDQIEKLAAIMSSLPKPNYDLTKYIFELLHDLSQHASETQMTADNLAKVISPNLIWKKELDIMDLSAVQDAMKGNVLAQVMIEHPSQLFKD